MWYFNSFAKKPSNIIFESFKSAMSPTWPKSYLGFAFDVANLCRQCRQQHWLAAKSCGHFSHASILKLKADIVADI